MAVDKGLIAGNTTMLILSLLDEKDMYGYEIIDMLSKRSNDTFALKSGTLYPLLHTLEEQDLLTSYEGSAEKGRVRKYYKITQKGKGALTKKKAEWEDFTSAVNLVLKGGSVYAIL